MKHPIDITAANFIDHRGLESCGLIIANLFQEEPSYSSANSSEVFMVWKTQKALEEFLDGQGLTPVYDDEALEFIEADE